MKKIHPVISGEDKSLLQKIEDLRTQLESVGTSTNQVKKWTKQAAIATEQGEKNVTMAERTIERVQAKLKVCSKPWLLCVVIQ